MTRCLGIKDMKIATPSNGSAAPFCGFFMSEIRFGGSGDGYNTRKGKKSLQTLCLVLKLPPPAGNQKSSVGVQQPAQELFMSNLITLADLNTVINHEPRVLHGLKQYSNGEPPAEVAKDCELFGGLLGHCTVDPSFPNYVAHPKITQGE